MLRHFCYAGKPGRRPIAGSRNPGQGCFNAYVTRKRLQDPALGRMISRSCNAGRAYSDNTLIITDGVISLKLFLQIYCGDTEQKCSGRNRRQDHRQPVHCVCRSGRRRKGRADDTSLTNLQNSGVPDAAENVTINGLTRTMISRYDKQKP